MARKSVLSARATARSKDIRKIRHKILSWGEKHYQVFPWRHARRKWHGLIAEILLQRTRAKNVVDVYAKFTSEFKQPSDLAKASLKRIRKIISPLGLVWRAKYLKALGKELVRQKSRVPNELPTLLKLPGVGPYAANAYLSFHSNKRGVIIDTNIVRTICRIVGAPIDGESRRKKWLIDFAETLTPTANWKQFNYALLDFSMVVCTKNPKCPTCPLGAELCLYGEKKLMHD